MPGESKRFRPLSLLLALSLAVLLPASSYPAFATSVVHGDVFEWSSFDKLDNAEVTVNSIPQQVMVSKNGSYSFNLDKGSYSIMARSDGNGSDVLFARENVTIAQDGGDYVIDLILFPSSDFSDLDLFNETAVPIPTDEPPDVPSAQPGQPSSNWAYLALPAIAVAGLFALALAFLALRKKKKPPMMPPEKAVEPAPPGDVPGGAVEEPEEPKAPPLAPVISAGVTLPDDLREVIRIIEKSGGRITQLDLRKALPYSEAKVSLMITDLESRGLVKKVKKGRGNVIILNRPGDSGEA